MAEHIQGFISLPLLHEVMSLEHKERVERARLFHEASQRSDPPTDKPRRRPWSLRRDA